MLHGQTSYVGDFTVGEVRKIRSGKAPLSLLLVEF